MPTAPGSPLWGEGEPVLLAPELDAPELPDTLTRDGRSSSPPPPAPLPPPDHPGRHPHTEPDPPWLDEQALPDPLRH